MFRETSIETCIRMKQITSPGWMHETSAQGCCTGKTQRDGVEGRWKGGSGWGTHVNPWLIHVNVWQKPLQYCKVISLQLIKINEKKKKNSKPLKTSLLRSPKFSQRQVPRGPSQPSSGVREKSLVGFPQIKYYSSPLEVGGHAKGN